MSLQITMIKAPGSVAASEKTHTFDSRGGTIGRGANNDLVLHDPDRFLSSQHCQIFCDAGHFFVIDLSTNGTFVNGSPEPLGKGGKTPLKNGDTFEVGDYVFEVKQAAASPFSASPFGSTEEPASDDFFSDAYSPNDSPNPFGPSHFLDDSLAVTEDISDPLAALDRVRPDAGGADLVANPFSSAPDQSPFSGPSYSDQAGVTNQAINWPEASTQDLIPEEWEDELGFGSSAPPTEEVFDQARGVPPKPEPVNRVAPKPLPPSEPVSDEPEVDVFTRGYSPTPRPSAMPDMPKPDPLADVMVAKEPPAPARVAESPAVASPVSGGPGAASDGLLKAMGLNAEKLSPEQVDQIGSEVGALIREVVGGMMQVLRSRSSIKNEFRMNVTTIQPVENNPLKFSADVDEALDNMFVRRGSAYKGSVDAVREGFQEIGEHQLAMIAGIRHGFEQMMTRFNPETLEKNFDKQGGSALPGMKKAKYWSSYHDYYKNFTDNMEHSFQHLFGSDFVHAYEDQLRKLKMGRKKDTR